MRRIFRVIAKRRLTRALYLQKLDYPSSNLGRSAVVFSPHFDDETLGCGGTILKKRQAGARVDVVFMTDGSKSHRRLMPEKELSQIRTKEGIAACQALGVADSHVHLLQFEETKLAERAGQAEERVAGLLQQLKPDEVFMPSRLEPVLWSEDHQATTRVVQTALKRSGCKAVVYEYPIWLWYGWPWTETGKGPVQPGSKRIGMSPGNRPPILQAFRCACYIGDVLAEKRHALSQHKSQMTQLMPDTRWKTLADVANGAFLSCFFQDYEFFHLHDSNMKPK